MLKLFNSKSSSTVASGSSRFSLRREEPPEHPDEKKFILQPNKSISVLSDKQKPCAACGQKPRKMNNKVCSQNCLILYNEQRNPDFWHQIQSAPGNDTSPPGYSPGMAMPVPHLDTKGLPNACLTCCRRTTDGTKDFCEGACVRAVTANGPLLLPVPESHHAFEKVVTLFKSSRPTGYTVYSVTRIFVTSQMWTAHQNYRVGLETRKDHPGANVKILWSWNAPCSTWNENTDPSGQLCGRSHCETCGIVNGSNISTYAYPRTTTRLGNWFKDGFYYDIVCEAALGHTFQNAKDPKVHSVIPPPGYDSAECQTYDWITLTAQKTAILPLYIVLFKHNR